jgi:hypothetical protein
VTAPTRPEGYGDTKPTAFERPRCRVCRGGWVRPDSPFAGDPIEVTDGGGPANNCLMCQGYGFEPTAREIIRMRDALAAPTKSTGAA